MPTAIPSPRHLPEQVALFQGDLLLTHDVCRFDPALAARRLAPQRQVLAVDIGGDKVRSARYGIGDGALTMLDERVHRSRGGDGYLAFLEDVARLAVAEDLRVGISSATKMNGSVVARTVNLPVFHEEFRQRYDADYERLFPGRSVAANDTITGICGASTLLALRGVQVRDVAFFVCGSGLGASVIAGGTAIHVEAAHVPVVEALNPLGQAAPCGVEGREFVCLDRIVPARAGIEDLYRKRTGEAKDGVAIASLYAAGDELATVLYETSALALAHAITGVTQRYRFRDTGSIVVLHGGMFEIPQYRRAVERCLDVLPHPPFEIAYSRDLSANACLDGAAILAAYSAGEPRG